jgi:hypothetical protein
MRLPGVCYILHAVGPADDGRDHEGCIVGFTRPLRSLGNGGVLAGDWGQRTHCRVWFCTPRGAVFGLFGLCEAACGVPYVCCLTRQCCCLLVPWHRSGLCVLCQLTRVRARLVVALLQCAPGSAKWCECAQCF